MSQLDFSSCLSHTETLCKEKWSYHFLYNFSSWKKMKSSVKLYLETPSGNKATFGKRCETVLNIACIFLSQNETKIHESIWLSGTWYNLEVTFALLWTLFPATPWHPKFGTPWSQWEGQQDIEQDLMTLRRTRLRSRSVLPVQCCSESRSLVNLINKGNLKGGSSLNKRGLIQGSVWWLSLTVNLTTAGIN